MVRRIRRSPRWPRDVDFNTPLSFYGNLRIVCNGLQFRLSCAFRAISEMTVRVERGFDISHQECSQQLHVRPQQDQISSMLSAEGGHRDASQAMLG